MEIQYMSPDSLIENEYNAKLHPDDQIDKIAKSIKEFGFNDPVAIDENNTIIEGHGRILAAKELGIQEIPTIQIENLTESEKIAYIQIHNKLTTETGFDYDKLKEEIQKLKSIDVKEWFAEMYQDPYFTEQEIEAEKSEKIIAICENENAGKVRAFLDSNNYQYKEKMC